MNTLGGKCYEEELRRDFLRVPVEICAVEKRRKCDSLYINLNKKLEKENNQLKNEIKSLKMSLGYIKTVLENHTLNDDLKSMLLEVIDNEN